ncbi:SDR family oxidoreductase [Spirochaeta isovalerica]|uniref:Uncharacterized protein YbjT (DUF2867 family) n=1 Tax=Spirochaeta isovalerica TaxID=150 RepID=A0A841R9B9_9SPIO|nr:SDR family oxidoreductase [Spirochaeta isovalerica]MBB6479797.1 uncharacterized protein YbjT (DUF2867 family) [Spirochaeta isovalerica]
MSEKILLAGATGYLGNHIARELKKKGYWVRVLIRKEEQKKQLENMDDYFVGSITDPDSLKGVTEGIDRVISTVGITRQKDGLTYMDVDYQGNANLLNEAKQSNVQSFMYISAINGDKMTHLKIFQAKERFVQELVGSGLDYVIIRPNGYFSDMADFLNMAKSGKVYLFGDGSFRLNPVSGKDLASYCVDHLNRKSCELTIGGPDLFSQNELAELALAAYGSHGKVIHLPDWIRVAVISLLRIFTGSKTYGPVEFFLTAMAMDNIAEQYGDHHLEDHFKAIVTNGGSDL